MGAQVAVRLGRGRLRRAVVLPGRHHHGCRHERTVIGGGAASVKLEQFRAVNTLLGNLKTAFAGTYHSFNFVKYAHRYLAEVQYRFNRRFDLSTSFVRLLRASAVTKPPPDHRLRAAEPGG